MLCSLKILKETSQGGKFFWLPFLHVNMPKSKKTGWKRLLAACRDTILRNIQIGDDIKFRNIRLMSISESNRYNFYTVAKNDKWHKYWELMGMCRKVAWDLHVLGNVRYIFLYLIIYIGSAATRPSYTTGKHNKAKLPLSFSFSCLTSSFFSSSTAERYKKTQWVKNCTCWLKLNPRAQNMYAEVTGSWEHYKPSNLFGCILWFK